MLQKLNFALLIGLASFAFACGSGNTNSSAEMGEEEEMISNNEAVVEENDPRSAVAVISGASGSNVSGTATFTEMDNGKVKLVIEVENLSEGEHALHLHENGDCSAADATSAGGHWNPTDDPHGKRGEDEYHSGDIDNMVVGADGAGSVEMEVEGWTIGDGSSSDILNKAVIIHAEADDFTSQPSGAAGARVACGVIQAGS
ncbi:superoxide dismutase, Cu-Zn family [Cyclobacterium lianum]|uniref:Superoxide dismutase, Cu-Zn family n=1 Tax=Cyclobacterium lianum TaxID=388280 RepID=A0A1M7N7W4_9BACT|nr:superoxide dismutase family protein [Cyclobacterium lianum]SHM99698.1 superoxide dismutase, Cu-Zn family [Cyclobacterium lianum]